jgi:hypothetical protein
LIGQHTAIAVVDDRARLSGVEIADQLGRTLDVGEERGNGFALTIGKGTRIG